MMGAEERDYELSLRPKRLREYIGQTKVSGNLDIFIKAALRRNESLDVVPANEAKRSRNHCSKGTSRPSGTQCSPTVRALRSPSSVGICEL